MGDDLGRVPLSLTAGDALAAVDRLLPGQRVWVKAVTRYGLIAEPLTYQERRGNAARFLARGDTYINVPVEDISIMIGPAQRRPRRNL